MVPPSLSLHAVDSPDVASLRSETVEHHPSSVRRPDWVVDPHVRVGEFVDSFWLSAVDWRDPEHLVTHDIHDARAIRGERHVRAAHHRFSKRLRVASFGGHLHGCRLSAARAAENNARSNENPAHEVPRYPDIS